MARGDALAEVVARSRMIPALLVLRDAHPEPLGVTQLTMRMEGYTGSGAILARVLADAGLVEMNEIPGPVAGKPAYAIVLTAKGLRLADWAEAGTKIVPDSPGKRA